MKILFSLLCLTSVAVSGVSIDIGNLDQCVVDIQKNAQLPDTHKPFFSANYNQLMQQLQQPAVRDALPEAYQQSMLNPFIMYLRAIGPAGFQSIFYGAQNQQSAFFKQIIPDIVEAILQNGLNYEAKASNAFQEVVDDLYDGFISEESRRSKETGTAIKPPDKGILPPLVKWGNPDIGPYTWPVDTTAELKLGAAVVSLPPSNLRGGLLAWSTLPHETCGHDILHADTGLLEELGKIAYQTVLAMFPGNTFLANYWMQCIDETASDVLGILNAGPTAGIALVGYFRGLLGGKLRNIGALPPADTHPVDILRGFIAARIVEQLSFSAAKEWADVIRKEVMKDLSQIYLVDTRAGQRYLIPQDMAIKSAELVADVIANTRLNSLEGHALKEIQNWSDEDQKIAEQFGNLLREKKRLPKEYKTDTFFAAHVLAGATIEALKTGADVQALFNHMVRFLNTMHRNNANWKKRTPPAFHVKSTESENLTVYAPRLTTSRQEEFALTGTE